MERANISQFESLMSNEQQCDSQDGFVAVNNVSLSLVQLVNMKAGATRMSARTAAVKDFLQSLEKTRTGNQMLAFIDSTYPSDVFENLDPATICRDLLSAGLLRTGTHGSTPCYLETTGQGKWDMRGNSINTNPGWNEVY